jgi:Tol biopolymer transport system component
MLNRRWGVTMCLSAAASCLIAASPSDLATEMKRLKVPEALILASEAVDEEPVWAPDGKFLAVNVEGRWVKVDLRHVSLAAATWRGNHPIGVASPKATLSAVAPAQIQSWRKSARFGARRVVAADGTTAELNSSELGTAFVVAKRGEKPETRWTSDMENCHSLALSPDGRYVAFISELNGVVVAKLSWKEVWGERTSACSERRAPGSPPLKPGVRWLRR